MQDRLQYERSADVSRRRFKRAGVIIGTLLATGALAGTALATLTVSGGGAQIKVDKRTNDTPSSTSQTQWVDLPGAGVGVFVPANTSRLYDVPFFAESLCNGPNTGACTVRIVAVANGVTTELDPQAGADYAFDSDMAGAFDDLGEGHGMERSRRLGGGANGTNYVIKVQYAVTNNQSTFTLDDWHLAVLTSV